MTTPPPLGPDWSVPQGPYGQSPYGPASYGPQPYGQVPPGPPPRPIRVGRVFAGIGLAMLGHLLTIGIAILVGVAMQWRDPTFLGVGAFAQLTLFILCLVFGILQIVRGDRGIGIGLLIGWAIGIIVLPVVGFGACIAAYSSMGPIAG